MSTNFKTAQSIAEPKESRQETMLERCMDQQGHNAAIVSRISDRVHSLLARLRGATPMGCGESMDEAEGMVCVHLRNLQSENVDLGRLEADIVELENLL